MLCDELSMIVIKCVYLACEIGSTFVEYYALLCTNSIVFCLFVAILH